MYTSAICVVQSLEQHSFKETLKLVSVSDIPDIYMFEIPKSYYAI